MTFFQNCLIDLHLHLDGSISVGAARKLAALQGLSLPDDDGALKSRLCLPEGCTDLNEYLSMFAFPCSLLQTGEAIAEAVFLLKEELVAQGFLYAEIRFAPQKHLERGLTQKDVVAAALSGMKRSSLPSGLILCCMRGDGNEAENRETVLTAEEFLSDGVCAVDLAGAEGLYPTENFRELFALAAQRQIPFIAHAGEAAGPESVRCALEYGVKRIGHGIRSVEDPALVEQLAERRIPLELCPTSNLNTSIYPNMRSYPIRTLMDAGVVVTVNTDNMSVSNTTVRGEFQKLTEALDFTREEIGNLLLNAVDASFADRALKESMRRKIRESAASAQRAPQTENAE